MRRLYGWLGLASLCGVCCTSLWAADHPAAVRFVPTMPPGVAPTVPPSAKPPVTGKPSTPTFAERMQVARKWQEQQKAAEENRPKPSVWQLQNPPNAANYNSPSMTGTVATNNYFGSQFHSWSNISQPATMTQLPFNQTAVPPINQTNLYTAPNNYYGGEFSSWSNLRGPQMRPNTFGGWNYR